MAAVEGAGPEVQSPPEEDLADVAIKMYQDEQIEKANKEFSDSYEQRVYGTTPAQKLLDLGKSIGQPLYDLTSAAGRGVAKRLEGVTEFGLDMFSPDLAQKFKKGMDQQLEAPPDLKGTWTESIGNLVGDIGVIGLTAEAGGAALAATGVAEGAGILGTISRFIAGSPLVRAAGAGAVAGGTSYQPDDEASNRWLNRGIEALEGAVGGAALGTVGSRITARLNARQMQRAAETVQERYPDVSPSLDEAREELRASNQAAESLHTGLSQMALREGDRLGPLPTARLGQDLGALEQGLSRSMSVDRGSRDLLERIRMQLAPDTPDTISTRLGDWVRQPNGSYMMGTARIPSTAVDAWAQPRGLGRFAQGTYRDLQGRVDDINSYLERYPRLLERRDPGAVALREARDRIEQEMSIHRTPTMTGLLNRARTLRDGRIAQLQSPLARQFMRARDPRELSRIVREAVNSGDRSAAQELAGALNPRAQDAVRNIMVQEAAAFATRMDTQTFDPVRFVRWFERPGAGPFMTNELRGLLGGVRGVMDDAAYRAGESGEVTLPHSWFHYGGHYVGPAGFIISALHGNWTGMAVAGSATFAVQPFMRWWVRVTNQRYGRSLLASARLARPGSPRMARIVQALAQLAGPTAVASGAGSLTGSTQRNVRQFDWDRMMRGILDRHGVPGGMAEGDEESVP